MTVVGKVLRSRITKVLLVLAVLGAPAAAIALNKPLQARALTYWNGALEWAGLRSHSHEEDGTTYWCPMHPQIKRNKPNEVCPICNMALVPLEEGAGGSSDEGLVLTTRQVQQAGVVTEPVFRRRLQREIDTTGRLDYDERLHHTVTSWVTGKSRINKIHVKFVGEHVEKGSLLAEIYNPELIAEQDTLLIYLDTQAEARLVESSKQKLEYLGMTPAQIEELVRQRKAWKSIPVYARASGTVVKPPLRDGSYVNEGEPILHLADLSRLWLYADVYEDELPLVKEGQEATLSFRALPDQTITGKVAFIDPMVQSQSRTVRARIDVDNRPLNSSPGTEGKKQWVLKPGMYARARLQARFPPMLAVPESAVLWSGRRAVVIVKTGEGLFRPTEVQLGQKWLYPEKGDPSQKKKLDFGATEIRYHQVLAGLMPGDEIVTSGAFLLNAESQFQSILTKMLPAKSRSATLEKILGEPVAGKLREVLDRYYALTRSLAADEVSPLVRQAEAFSQAAGALATEAEKAGLSELAKEARHLGQLASGMADAALMDLKDARAHYGRISRSLIQLLSGHGGRTLFGDELFLFRCGMSKVGYENWLWWSREKHNPYMGPKMLQCGSELKALKP